MAVIYKTNCPFTYHVCNSILSVFLLEWTRHRLILNEVTGTFTSSPKTRVTGPGGHFYNELSSYINECQYYIFFLINALRVSNHSQWNHPVFSFTSAAFASSSTPGGVASRRAASFGGASVVVAVWLPCTSCRAIVHIG